MATAAIGVLDPGMGAVPGTKGKVMHMGANLHAIVWQGVKYSEFTAASAAGYVDLPGAKIPVGAIVIGWQALIRTAFAGDTTGAMTIGDGSDADILGGSTSVSAYTAGVVASCPFNPAGVNGGSGAIVVTTAIQPRVTITGSAAWTNVTAGVMDIAVLFVMPDALLMGDTYTS